MSCFTLLRAALQGIPARGYMLSGAPETEAMFNQQNRLLKIIGGDQKAKSLLYACDSLM